MRKTLLALAAVAAVGASAGWAASFQGAPLASNDAAAVCAAAGEDCCVPCPGPCPLDCCGS